MLQLANVRLNSSDQFILSLGCNLAIASSRWARTWEQWGRTRPGTKCTLQAPMNDRIPNTVSGGLHEESTAILCGLADTLAWFQIHPKMVVDRGQIIFCDGDRRGNIYEGILLHITLNQLNMSCSGVSPPQYRSSASLATKPSCKQSPSTPLGNFVLRFTIKMVSYFYLDFDRLVQRSLVIIDPYATRWLITHLWWGTVYITCCKHAWLEITAVLNPSEFYGVHYTYMYLDYLW